MLPEYRAGEMLNELFGACGRFLLKEISLEKFAEIVERLAEEKTGNRKLRRRQNSQTKF